MTKRQAVTIDDLRTKSPWAIADRLGIDYSGDMSPIPHDGYFYDSSQWLDCKSAAVVEFCTIEDRVIVSIGDIDRPNDVETMKSVLRCCGLKYSDDIIGIESEHGGDIVAATPEAISRVEIEAIKSYSGMNTDFSAEFPFVDDPREAEFQAMRFAVTHLRTMQREKIDTIKQLFGDTV
jgi:hypothetical protein